MDFSTIIYLLVSVILIIDGVYAIIKGTQLFSTAKEKELKERYPDTYELAHRVFGAGLAATGICLLIHQAGILLAWFETSIFLLIAIGLIIVSVIVYYVILKGKTKKKLKSKDKKNNISGYNE